MREIHKDNTLHCVEYEPQCRTIDIQSKKYYLSLPYMQFTIIDRSREAYEKWSRNYLCRKRKVKKVSSFHATFSNKPVKTIKSPVFFPPLPNIYPRDSGSLSPHCQVCLGGNYRRRANGSIFEMISNFWQTSFDGHWSNLILDTPSLRTYLIWSEKTQEEPSFITKIKWPVNASISDFSYLQYESYGCLAF